MKGITVSTRNRSLRRASAAIIGAAALVLVTACGSNDEPAASADKVDVVNLLSASGATPNLVLFASYVGVTSGNFDEKNKLDATIKQSPSAQATAALISGNEHFSMTSFGATATAIAKGLPLKIVGSYALEVPGAIVATKKIKSFSDLEGKKIIAAALGNTSQINVTAYGQATGHDPSKLQFVASGNTANSIQYLSAGRGDAAWIQIDSIPKLLKDNPNLHVLVTAEELSKAVGTIGGVVVVTESYAKSHGDVIVKVMKSLMQASRVLYTDGDYFLAEAKKAFPAGTFTDEQLKTLYPTLQKTHSVNGGMDKTLIDKSYKAWSTYFDPAGAKEAKFTTGEEVIDPSFVKQALKELGGPMAHPVDSADLAR